METTAKITKRKIIDIYSKMFYAIYQGSRNGTNLKRYIEWFLIKDVEDMDNSKTYAYLSKTRSEGHIMSNDEEQKAFERKYGL